MENKSPISLMPNDLRLYTATFLDNASLCNLFRVNKIWNSTLSNHDLWKERLVKATEYQCEQNENPRLILTRLEWLKSLTDDQLFQHYVNSSTNNAIIALARYKPSDFIRVKLPTIIDIKLLLKTSYLWERLNAKFIEKYSYLDDDVFCASLEDLLQIYLTRSKLLRKFYWSHNLSKQFHYYNDDFLEMMDCGASHHHVFFSYRIIKLLEIFYEYQLNIYSENFSEKLIGLYRSNDKFKNVIISRDNGCDLLSLLCYCNSSFAKTIITDSRERVNLSDEEITDIGAKHPEIGYFLLNNSDLKSHINKGDLKLSKPSFVSRVAGALAGGLLGGIFAPLIYLFKQCGACYTSEEIGYKLFLNLLLLPPLLYGVIRGVHAGATRGFLDGVNIIDILILQDMYATYPNWNQRNYRTNTVADSAAQYQPEISIVIDERKPLLEKNQLQLLPNYQFDSAKMSFPRTIKSLSL